MEPPAVINNQGVIMFYFQKKAFTLAEILIVMALIGVIATMIIPGFSKNITEKETVTKVQKMYEMLETTLDSVVVNAGGYTGIFQETAGTGIKLHSMHAVLYPMFDVKRNCGNQTNSAEDTCWYGEGTRRTYILSDNSVIAYRYFNFYTYNFFTDTSIVYMGLFGIDINGPDKGPNSYGVDLFDFYITSKGLIPLGTQLTTVDAVSFDACLTASGLSKYCTAWIVQKGNMDYLKADTTGKCPSGVTLGWITASACN